MKCKLFKFVLPAILLLASCNHDLLNQEQLCEDSSRKTELVQLALLGNYFVSNDCIMNDLESFLNNDSNFRTCINQENKLRFTIIDTKEITSPIQDNAGYRSAEISDISNITFNLVSIEQAEDLNYIALTCNDRRIGEILAIMDERDFSYNISDNQFMQIVVCGLENYINDTINIWNSITDEDLNFARNARQSYSDIVTDSAYIYYNWKLNSKICDMKTLWQQDEDYANAIRHYYGNYEKKQYGNQFVAGCGAVALSQIIAYKGGIKSCSQASYNKLIDSNWTGMYKSDGTKWDGVFDWNNILSEKFINNLSNDYKNQISAFIFDVAEGIESEYSVVIDNNGYFSSSTSCEPRFCRYYLSGIDYTSEEESIYEFEKVKSSINGDSPVFVTGYSMATYEESSFLFWKWQKIKELSNGHAWIIDGYATGSCMAENVKTKQTIEIVNANFVRCNAGWGNSYANGYYLEGIFDMSKSALLARSGKENYYQFALKMITKIKPRVSK